MDFTPRPCITSQDFGLNEFQSEHFPRGHFHRFTGQITNYAFRQMFNVSLLIVVRDKSSVKKTFFVDEQSHSLNLFVLELPGVW